MLRRSRSLSRSRSPSPSRSRSTSPKVGKQEIPEDQEQLVTDLLAPDMIEKIASELEKMVSLRPWLQVSKGTRKHSRYL